VFVFPTLQDLVGRVVVEALTVGVPVVLSPLTGAAGTLVEDDVNGIVVDPRDTRALAEAMRRATEPQTLRCLREGVRRTNGSLTPDASAGVVLRAVALARGPAGPR
jgi:glycosyltransferase involved in cell wall biosynthesis